MSQITVVTPDEIRTVAYAMVSANVTMEDLWDKATGLAAQLKRHGCEIRPTPAPMSNEPPAEP